LYLATLSSILPFFPGKKAGLLVILNLILNGRAHQFHKGMSGRRGFPSGGVR
jgi:hypothetical protein